MRLLLKVEQLTALADHGKKLAVVSSSSAAGLVGAASTKQQRLLLQKVEAIERDNDIQRWKEGSADFTAAMEALKAKEVQR